METNVPCKIGGNVLNQGLIPNLPSNACVEVPCLVDACGVTPCFAGNLPEQCAALNRTNINVQLMTIDAALDCTLKKDAIYQAAMLDPHCQSELSIDDIVALCDDMIAAQRGLAAGIPVSHHPGQTPRIRTARMRGVGMPGRTGPLPSRFNA